MIYPHCTSWPEKDELAYAVAAMDRPAARKKSNGSMEMMICRHFRRRRDEIVALPPWRG